MFLKPISEMPSDWTSGIAQEMTEDQILNELSDADVDIDEASEWNASVETNTPDDIKSQIPDSINPVDGLEVKGQDIFSSCFAASGVFAFERQKWQETGVVERYSIWAFYMLAQMQTPGLYGKDGGTVPPHGIKAATKIGFLPESLARKHLPPALVAKWSGDVYPRNYWDGRGSQRQFNEAGKTGYREACAAYESILKLDEVREAMYANRFTKIIRNKTPEDVIASEKTQTATTWECHVWGSSMDSHPDRLMEFPGPAPQPGAQHGHHATAIGGLHPSVKPIKANSWRPYAALKQARETGNIDLSGVQEWGDDGFKVWEIPAYRNMMNHPQSFSFACSNITVTESEPPMARIADTSNRQSFM